MVKVKLTGFLESASGKLAGSTFHSDNSGLRIINKAGKRKVKSTLSNAQNRRIRIISQGWRSLTTAQRARWEGFAKSYNSTGFQLFLKANSGFLIVSTSLLTTPVFPRAFSRFVGWNTFTFVGGTLAINVSFADNVSGIRAAVYISKPLGSKRSIKSQSFRFQLATPTAVSMNLSITGANFVSLFGYMPPVGFWITVRIDVLDTANGLIYASFYNQVKRS